MRIKSESANIGGGFHDDSDFKGQDFSEVKEAIKNKNYHLAQGLLDAMQERSAEWHYMQAKIYYDKKWILDAKKQLELAIEMDPTNAKYTATLDRLKKRAAEASCFRRPATARAAGRIRLIPRRAAATFAQRFFARIAVANAWAAISFLAADEK